MSHKIVLKRTKMGNKYYAVIDLSNNKMVDFFIEREQAKLLVANLDAKVTPAQPEETS